MQMYVKCPLCDREWDLEFNYCPIDGRSLKAAKAEVLHPGRYLPELPVADNADLSRLYADVFGQMSDAPKPDVVQVRNWLSSMNKQWAQVLIHYYGLGSQPPQTYAQIGAMAGVRGAGIRAKAENARRRIRQFERESRR